MHENRRLPSFINEAAIDGAALFAQYWGRGHGLKPEGKIHFNRFLEKIKTGQKTHPLDNMRILDGFSYEVEGTDLLENQKGILLLSNHSVEGPLRGYGNTFLIDYIFYQAAEEKIRWMQGKGSSAIELIHEALGQATNTITVGNGNGTSGVRELLKAWERGESVGLYPEGVQKKDLQKGDPRAGKLMLLAVKREIQIFTAASYFENGHFRVSIDHLNNEALLSAYDLPSEFMPEQAMIDYAMTMIARHLPPEKRGAYKMGVGL